MVSVPFVNLFSELRYRLRKVKLFSCTMKMYTLPSYIHAFFIDPSSHIQGKGRSLVPSQAATVDSLTARTVRSIVTYTRLTSLIIARLVGLRGFQIFFLSKPVNNSISMRHSGRAVVLLPRSCIKCSGSIASS